MLLDKRLDEHCLALGRLTGAIALCFSADLQIQHLLIAWRFPTNTCLIPAESQTGCCRNASHLKGRALLLRPAKFPTEACTGRRALLAVHRQAWDTAREAAIAGGEGKLLLCVWEAVLRYS